VLRGCIGPDCDVAAELVVVSAAAESRLEFIVDASIGEPDIVASHQSGAIGFEGFQQSGVCRILVFAEEIDGPDVCLAVHVGLAGEDEDYPVITFRESCRYSLVTF
jgi:hypothetical protein